MADEAWLIRTEEDGVYLLSRQQWIHRFLFDDGGIIDVVATKDDPFLREAALAYYQKIPNTKPKVAIVGMALVERVDIPLPKAEALAGVNGANGAHHPDSSLE